MSRDSANRDGRPGRRDRPFPSEKRRSEHDGPQPESAAEDKLGREHPKVRTAHGTRVARSIQCGRCGARDTLHFIPRNRDRALCRKCAAELLEVGDRDAGIFPTDDEESPSQLPPPPSQRRETGKGVIRVRKRPEDE